MLYPEQKVLLLVKSRLIQPKKIQYYRKLATVYIPLIKALQSHVFTINSEIELLDKSHQSTKDKKLHEKRHYIESFLHMLIFSLVSDCILRSQSFIQGEELITLIKDEAGDYDICNKTEFILDLIDRDDCTLGSVDSLKNDFIICQSISILHKEFALIATAVMYMLAFNFIPIELRGISALAMFVILCVGLVYIFVLIGNSHKSNEFSQKIIKLKGLKRAQELKQLPM